MPFKTRKQVRHPPSYYKQRSQNLAQEGRTPRPLADTTKKGIQSQLKKVTAYCDEIGRDTNEFLKSASVADIKTYFEWVIHRHNRITTGSSIKNYWRVLKMHMLNKFERQFTEDDVADVRNYLTVLQKKNSLRVHLLPKPVLDKDAVYKLLYILWVLDTRVYPDERQRVQDHGGVLLSTFFGCRLTSIFDTRVKLDPWDPNTEERVDDTSTQNSKTASETDEEGLSAAENEFGDDKEEEDNDGDDDYNDFGLEDMVDDDCLSGNDQTRTFLYRHITIFVVSNSVGSPNTVFMKITQPNTKGQDRNPRVKTLVIDGIMDHPLFCLLDVILALAIDGNAFESEHAHDVRNIFWARIPSDRGGIRLRWKEKVLDLPVFRQPTRTGTHPTAPLKARTYSYRLQHLGRLAGFEYSLGQKWFRRGLLNVVNRKVPSSVRDQLFDHKLGSAGYYLDQDVLVDTKALFLGRLSDDTIHKMARQVTLTAAPDAPMELTQSQSKRITQHPKIMALKRKDSQLTTQLRNAGFASVEAAKGTPLYGEKIKARNTYRNAKGRFERQLLNQARAAWFRTADTVAFENQFSEAPVDDMPQTRVIQKYSLKERATIVTIIHQHDFKSQSDDEEMFHRRLNMIQTLAAICQKQDTRLEVAQQSTESLLDPKLLWPDDCQELDKKHEFPMICKPTQCVWCLGDTRKTYEARKFEYSRANKMLDEADRHLRPYASDDEVPCPHPICQEADKVLSNKIHFKSHLARDHKIYLRACH